MEQRNQMYSDIDTVISIVGDLYPGLDIDKGKAVEWAAYAQMHDLVIIRDWFLFKNVPLVVDQKKALIPCNCHKLLDVMKDGIRTGTKFRRDGSYLFFDDNYEDITINYRGFPVNDQGKPLFVRGTERALARYLIMNAHEMDYISGKLDGQRWAFLVEKWEDEKDTAKAQLRTLTRNEIEEILMINADMIPKLGYIPTVNLD